MIKTFLPKVSKMNLHKKTQRIGSIYKLFRKIINLTIKKEVKRIGINKAYRILYSVKSISELTNTQILSIIDQVVEKSYDIITINHNRNNVTKNSKKVNASSTLQTIPAEIKANILQISQPNKNMLVILYNAYALYSNVTLKKYPYLFLYNSDKCNDRYEFKSSDLYLRCEKEHNKEKVVGRYIKGSYYIKY